MINDEFYCIAGPAQCKANHKEHPYVTVLQFELDFLMYLAQNNVRLTWTEQWRAQLATYRKSNLNIFAVGNQHHQKRHDYDWRNELMKSVPLSGMVKAIYISLLWISADMNILIYWALSKTHVADNEHLWSSRVLWLEPPINKHNSQVAVAAAMTAYANKTTLSRLSVMV